MGDIVKLLEPISSQQPAGVDLYYSPEFDKIREARRQEESAPKGIWEREIKSADYKLLSKLSEEILEKKTKDLRLAVWLAEAWIYCEGASGLVSGIQMLHAMLEKFWDGIYPLIDGNDVEDRAAPLEWFGSYFDPTKGSSPKLAICRIPLVKGKYDFFSYQESRKVGYEADVKDSETRKKARAELIKEGKLSAEAFDKVFEETPKALYKQLDAEYKQSLEALSQFDIFCREKFKDRAPSFATLRKTVEEVANSVQILLARKLKADPDPAEDVKPEESAAAQTATAAPSRLPGSTMVDLSNFAGGNISSADQAMLHVLAAAQFLRQNNPSSPLSYLLLRALRWGEVRASGEIKSAELSAPAGEIRVALRNAAGAHNWRQVLDVAETAMSNPTGRGWLDLQRYSVKACEELGYTSAAKALRSELKCFLMDFPQLPKAILDDDTGTANPETLAWLEKEGLLPTSK
jgi:type VI secretion system protein ImpA